MEQTKKQKVSIKIIITIALMLICAISGLLLSGCSNDEFYTVTFMDSLGNNLGSVEVLENGLINKPETPTRTGYTFEGWYTDTNYSKLWKFESYTTVEDTTLYAKMIANSYNLYTNIDNNEFGSILFSVNMPDNYSTSNTTAKFGDIVFVKVSPKDGYQLKNVDYSGVSILNTTVSPKEDNYYQFYMPSNHITCIADFELRDYGITTSKSGGGEIVVTSEAKYNSTVNIQTIPNAGYMLSSIWVNNVKISGSTFKMPNKETEIFVEFAPRTYIVTLDYSNYSTNMISDTIAVKYKAKFTNLPTNIAAVEPYAFGGFYTEDGTLVDDNYVLDTPSNITLYARKTDPTKANLFGDGSESSPFRIYHSSQVADIVNNSTTYYYYFLMNDISLDENYSSINLFGNFNGNNKTITLNCPCPIFNNIGGTKSYTSAVKNIVIKLTNAKTVGLIANSVDEYSSVTNCQTTTNSTITLTGNNYFGFVKTNFGTISNCTNNTTFTLSGNSQTAFSAIVQSNFGTLSTVFNLAEEIITTREAIMLCGIAIYNYGEISSGETRSNLIGTTNTFSICYKFATSANAKKEPSISFVTNYGSSSCMVGENLENLAITDCYDYAYN